jgi:hypothetical protein
MGHLRGQLYCVSSFWRARVTSLMLGHILRHHLVVESKRVLISKVIVKFTSLGLNQKRPTRLGGVV